MNAYEIYGAMTCECVLFLPYVYKRVLIWNNTEPLGYEVTPHSLLQNESMDMLTVLSGLAVGEDCCKAASVTTRNSTYLSSAKKNATTYFKVLWCLFFRLLDVKVSKFILG